MTKTMGQVVVALLLTQAAAFAQQPPVPAKQEQTGSAVPASHAGSVAPDFVLKDTAGKLRHLSEFRGRRVGLFFFCGCQACAEVMRAWGQAQRAEPNSKERTKKTLPPVTLIVYTAEAADVLAAAKRNGLDLTRTVLLPDPDVAVSLDVYGVDPCPRVFVLDEAGVIRYTNNHADDAPQKAPGSVIVAKALNSLHTQGTPAGKAAPNHR